MKKIICLLSVLLITVAAHAQKKKPAAPAMPDMNQLMKMSPAELEAYKKKMIKETSEYAADYADANNMAINKALLPGYESEDHVLRLAKYFRFEPGQSNISRIIPVMAF